MTDISQNDTVNSLNVFGADEMVTRRLAAKALLQQKVAEIHQKRERNEVDVKERVKGLNALLELDPRYIEIAGLLKHADMKAISESLEEFMKAYLNSWYPDLTIETILSGDVKSGRSSLQRYRLDKGIGINTIIHLPEVLNIQEGDSDLEVLSLYLRNGAFMDVQCFSNGKYSWENVCWLVRICVIWNERSDGIQMTYFDSSVHETQQPISRLDEVFEKVAVTLSNPPRLWARARREWSAFEDSHREAIKAFKVMSKGSSLGQQLGSYFDLFDLWNFGIEDEVKLVIQQIHHQFHQTDLLQQIANNTSSGARFSAASYGVSSSNAVALSGISEQIAQLSTRVEQLSHR